jgi:type II secretory pathway component PulF
MRKLVQFLMLGVPDTHFVMLVQVILYRGAGISVVWRQFAILAVIGTVLFSLSLARFRKTLGTMTRSGSPMIDIFVLDVSPGRASETKRGFIDGTYLSQVQQEGFRYTAY